MKTQANPNWWTRDDESAWGRAAEALRRDWQQTKHDFGFEAPDLDQDVPDTVGQMAGMRPIPPRGTPNYEDVEPGYRFGFSAQRHYREQFGEWNDELEDQLEDDWRLSRPDEDEDDWERMRPAIQRGWEYRMSQRDVPSGESGRRRR